MDRKLDRNIVTAIKSWPATVLSEKGLSLFRLPRHTTGVIDSLRQSRVDNTDRWTLSPALDPVIEI